MEAIRNWTVTFFLPASQPPKYTRSVALVLSSRPFFALASSLGYESRAGTLPHFCTVKRQAIASVCVG